ncbi:sulfonate ABC transporter substrate-binding protein [Undibacterium sp. TC4M20W]|uniref:sulfonate ABC transporter substrate-binding protein n=1 Tax=Undibacterium sp. TC4M20W TaxID=3413052 RepID=UPI003BF1C64F
MKKLSLFILFKIILLTSLSAMAADDKLIAIGFQKGSGLLSILKAQGTLEKTLAAQKLQVKWIEFPAGPQLLEALNAGNVDFGLTGAPPPIFAQAAGVDLLYVGAEPSSPACEAILVPKESPIKTVADLKGKKVAFQKGSSSNLLILAALRKAGLGMQDIQPIHLSPADARAAFVSGNIDAWIVWDPYLASVQHSLPVRVLADHQGLLPANSFYEASRRLVEKNPQALNTILAELAATAVWANQHPQQLASTIAGQLGMPLEVITTWQQRSRYGVMPVNATVVSRQQEIADLFYQNKLIPKAVRINDKAWLWVPRAGN